MPKITPFLWFDHQAEEATKFYVSVFENSKMLGVTRNGEGGPGPKGSVLTAAFELDGQVFTALNGGPLYSFSEAVSFVVHCKTQQEVDKYWDQLTKDGGQPGRCGWLKDKFGVSWQVVPTVLPQMLGDQDPKRAQRVGQALMQMKKLDIARLQAAYNGA